MREIICLTRECSSFANGMCQHEGVRCKYTQGGSIGNVAEEINNAFDDHMYAPESTRPEYPDVKAILARHGLVCVDCGEAVGKEFETLTTGERRCVSCAEKL